MNKFFHGLGRVEYRPDAPCEDTLVYRHYNPSENINGRPMEEWLKFSVSYFNAFRYNGEDGIFGDRTHQRPYDDGSHSMDNYKRRLMAAFEFMHKLGLKWYSVSDRDLSPEADNLDETSQKLEEMVNMAYDLQKQSGIRPLYFSCDLFSHPRYAQGAATSPDAHVFAYACTQLKRGLEAAKRLNAENFLFFLPRDGYESYLQRQPFRDMTHMAQLYKMAVQYRDKIGYRGQFLIQPKPSDPRRQNYECDAMATINMLRHFGLEKYFKLNVKPSWSRQAGRPFEHDVLMAAAFNMLGGVEVADSRNEFRSAYDSCSRDVRKATLVMRQVLEQGGFGTGGLTLSGRLERDSIELRDLFNGFVLAIDTWAAAFRAAARLVQDSQFNRAVQQRYSTFKSGLGDRIEKGAATFEDCEDFVRKNGEPKPQSSRHEHFEQMMNYYVFPKQN